MLRPCSLLCGIEDLARLARGGRHAWSKARSIALLTQQKRRGDGALLRRQRRLKGLRSSGRLVLDSNKFVALYNILLP